MLVTSLSQMIPWRKKWPPTPTVLPGESQGQRNLAGTHLKIEGKNDIRRLSVGNQAPRRVSGT